MVTIKLSFNHLLLLLTLSLLIVGCKPSHRDRPYGYLKLGPIKNYLAPETFLSEDRFLIRHDENGFSAMSTLCTYDLSPLHESKSASGKSIWVSKFNPSSYSHEGKVIAGPTIKDLPYYELKLDSATYGGGADTLYVLIGEEKPATWRLPVKLTE